MEYLIKLILFVYFQSICCANKFMNSMATNFSCYKCIEPLVGYTDHPNSCRSFNTSSTLGLSYRQQCHIENYTGEYECRKLIISFRSIDIHLRRDCVPKGLCSWKDRTKAMETTPESNCIYTDDGEQKLECIYCCDTPLCNRTNSLVLLLSSAILCLLLQSVI